MTSSAPIPLGKSLRLQVGLAFGVFSMLLAVALSAFLGELSRRDLERELARQSGPPGAVAAAPLRRVEQRILLAGVAAGLVFSLLGSLMAGCLTGPLARMALAARRAADDDSAASLCLPERADEIGALGSAVDHLLATRERQARELRLSDERFRAALQSSGVVVFNQDCDLRYTWIHNQRDDFSRTSVLGRTDAEILGPQRSAELVAMKRGVLESGVAVRRTITLQLDTGARDREISVQPLRDRAGGVVGITCASVDVTGQRERERALRRAVVQFSSTFENAAVGISICALDGCWLRVNDRLCEITGYPRKELLGMSFAEVTHPDDVAESVAKMRELVAGERSSYTFEKRYRRKSGEVVWASITASLVCDESGAPEYCIGIIEDIDARKRAEQALRESEARFRIAAQCASDLIYDWDLATDGVEWFGDVDRVLGYEPGELAHRVAARKELLHPDDGDRVDSAVRRHLETGAPFHEEYRVMTKDSGVRIWTDCAVALRDAAGKPYRWIGVTTDVTERKTASQQLEQAKEFAEAASRAKDDFLAALSHELRTPLNPVLMLASELENSPEVPGHLRQDFASIRKNIELEARLIDDLLDLTRVTRGKLRLKLETVDAHTLLHKSLEICRTEIEAKQLIVTLDLSAPDRLVAADAVRLQQVFWNVIKNAVKFTPPGGSIAIRSRTGAHRVLLVEVADNGLGIEPEELTHIFEAFVQGKEAGSHRFGGLGLGLSISQLLMQAHGGRIRPESAGRGRGATFHLELPLAPADAVATPAPAATGPARVTPRRILLVEDHEATRSLLTRLLARRGHEIAAADCLATARALAAASEFDLVISDIGLPDGTGHDLMAELSAHYGLTGIALSGYGMEEDVRRSLEVGFAAHLTKPVDMPALERAIEQAGAGAEKVSLAETRRSTATEEARPAAIGERAPG